MAAWTAFTTLWARASPSYGSAKTSRAREAERAQIGAADARALGRRQPGRVLLDHQPAVVADLAQRSKQLRHIHTSAAELGEYPPANRVVEAHPVSPYAIQDVAVHVLQMDVRDALGMRAHDGDRIDAAVQSRGRRPSTA